MRVESSSSDRSDARAGREEAGRKAMGREEAEREEAGRGRACAREGTKASPGSRAQWRTLSLSLRWRDQRW
jgi:hypothetical protein